MEEKEFAPITSQEALDAVIKDRLNRQNEKHSKEVEELKAQLKALEDVKAKESDYQSQLDELNKSLAEASDKITEYDSQIAEKDKAIHGYEVGAIKNQVAQELGLSFDAVELLKGEDEETIRKSAETLKTLISKANPSPVITGEPAIVNQKQASIESAYKQMIGGLNK